MVCLHSKFFIFNNVSHKVTFENYCLILKNKSLLTKYEVQDLRFSLIFQNLGACDALQYADLKQVSVAKPHIGTMWNHSLPPPPYSSRTGASSIAKQPIHDAYSYGCTSSSRGYKSIKRSYNEKHRNLTQDNENLFHDGNGAYLLLLLDV